MNEVQAPVAHHEPWILKINILKYCLCTDILFFFLPSDDLPISMIALYLLKKKKHFIALHVLCLTNSINFFQILHCITQAVKVFCNAQHENNHLLCCSTVPGGKLKEFFFLFSSLLNIWLSHLPRDQTLHLAVVLCLENSSSGLPGTQGDAHPVLGCPKPEGRPVSLISKDCDKSLIQKGCSYFLGLGILGALLTLRFLFANCRAVIPVPVLKQCYP